MLSPQEALERILAEASVTGAVDEVPLSEASGRVLASDVESDVDLPPFEKSAMDGFAVRLADFAGAEGEVELEVLGESKAGAPYGGPIRDGQCVAIYTGAEAPADCDAVVMVEKTRREGDKVWIADAPSDRQNNCAKGEDLSVGRVVLEPGRRLRPVSGRASGAGASAPASSRSVGMMSGMMARALMRVPLGTPGPAMISGTRKAPSAP